MSYLINRSAASAVDMSDAQRDDDRRRRHEFNNFQFESHVAQERLSQFYMLGKGHRGEKLMRENSQPLGNHWFSGGVTPDSHVVGKPSLPAHSKPLSIVHPLMGDSPVTSQPPPVGNRGSSNSAQRSYVASPASSPIVPQAQQQQQQQQQQYPPPPGTTPSRHWDPADHGPGKVVPSPFSIQDAHTPHTVERPAGEPPFAEHFPTERTELDAVAVPHFKAGLSRGLLGVDFETGRARDAQRLVARMRHEQTVATKHERQRQLKAALDAQISDKQQRRAAEWQAEVTVVYGDGLQVGWDAAQRAGAQKEHHRALMQTWGKQAAEHTAQRTAEDAHYAPHPEDWQGMQLAMDASRQRDLAARAGAGQEWLQAWQEHQAVEGAVRKAEVAAQDRRDMLAIGPSIANYSDRIAQAAQQKREAQAMYKAAIGQQVAEKRRRQQQQLAEEYTREVQRGDSQGGWPF